LAAVLAFGFLAVLTARAAFMASYLNYDRATEYLVYAHCGPGIKEALAQIEDLSRRTTGDLSIVVAYDNETTYPYWWYLRNYSNQRFFGANPTREQLRDAPVILAGSANYSKVAPLVRQAYYEFEYVRIWWPDESYKGLTWQRIKEIVLQPEQRAAIFKIWLNRDYSAFAALNKRDMSLPNWSPADRFKLYVRKDIAAQLWNYGTVSVEGSTAVDPYDKKGIELVANRVVGGLAAGQAPGSFNTPRAVAVAPDGTLYVADTLNHRIQHLSEDGQTVLGVWGSFGASSGTVAAPNGSFNEPWGVAVAPDGAVYVADTWNNRIQKFTADGQFITTWGYGISQKLEDPYGFYGPRGVAVDAKGRVYVTDTGNKRVVVFDGEGTYVTQLGSGGYDVGQFDEPVGVAVSADGLVYVADTWNQRIQTFQISGDGAYLALRTWDVAAWYGNSIDNKPYITVDQRGNVYVTDPEAFRVLVFNSSGEIRFYWGDTGGGESNFGKFINGIAADNASGVWVVDSANNRLLHFMPPLP
jgi:DNA-binding beta-propeller fold protein YncE